MQYTVCIAQYTVCIARYTVCSALYTVCIAQYTACSAQYTVCNLLDHVIVSLHCKLFSTHLVQKNNMYRSDNILVALHYITLPTL